MKPYKGLPESYINPRSYGKLLRNNPPIEEPNEKRPLWKKVLFFLALVATILIGSCRIVTASEISDKDGILSVLGEAESESYLGKIAVAKTILNRGTLKGVSAYKNTVLINGKPYKKVSLKSKYYKRTGNRYRSINLFDYDAAKKAWQYAKSTIGEGEWSATGWGNASDIKQFKREGWFKNCIITDKIGTHFFYKEAI